MLTLTAFKLENLTYFVDLLSIIAIPSSKLVGRR